MKITTLSKQHFLLNTASDMSEICEPLLQSLGISTFCYMRYFNDNTFYILTNDDEFIQWRIQVNCKFNPIVPKKMLKDKFIFLLDANDVSNKMLLNACKLLNTEYPIYLIERHKGYFESFHFYSKPGGIDLTNVYLNNLEILEKFKFYFRDKAKKLIEKANKNKIFAPVYLRPNFQGLGIEEEVMNSEKREILQQLDVKRYILTGKYEGISLSKREVDTLGSLASGHTIKEVAKLIDLAPRTAETYLNNIKNKLGLHKRSELVEFAMSNKILHF